MTESRGLLPPDYHKDLPFEGGSEPVPQVKDPVPGPAVGAMHWTVILICALIVLFTVVWVFAF